MRISFTVMDIETMTKGVKALKQWTWLPEVTLIYDVKTDPSTTDALIDKSLMLTEHRHQWVQERPGLVGAFCCVTGMKNERFNDTTIFAFSFESHGRCMKLQRFMVGEEG